MANVNVRRLASQAAGVAWRVDMVRNDPAVITAAKDAWVDTRKARQSTGVLTRAVGATWVRSGHC